MDFLPRPYQCIQKCGNVLVAARGPNIDAFNIKSGTLVSTWHCPTSQDPSSTSLKNNYVTVKSSKDGIDLDLASPEAKRRRLSNSAAENGSSQEDCEGESKIEQPTSASRQLSGPTVINMIATSNEEYLVAVTGEDKSIRVLRWKDTDDSDHSLEELSVRAMPKRPCAIALSKDDSTILSADKFGDVYALPLIEKKTPPDESNPPEERSKELGGSIPPSKSKPFKPAASDLTVHSARNLKALQNQLKHSHRLPEKSEPNFEHQLLLGHVSMLTDLILSSVDGRDYIITADRDEHIRVSRGVPQSHVIEGFCLGHTEFVSRLCIPKSRPDILISGGGENALFVWDWRAAKLAFREELSSYTNGLVLDSPSLLEDNSTSKDSESKARTITVSGIYHMRQSSNGLCRDIIMVTCERVPAVLMFELKENSHLQYLETLSSPGNVLGVAVDTSSEDGITRLILSIDTIHIPGTTTKLRENTDVVYPLQRFSYTNGSWNSDLNFQVMERYETDLEDKNGLNRLKEILYNLESLRKREGDNQAEE